MDSPDLKLEEGRITIFMNPDSNSKDHRTKAFLRYLKKSEISDTFTQTIEKAVRKVKESQDLRGQYMTLQEKFDEEKAAGIREGIEIGRAEGMKEGEERNRLDMCRNLLSKKIDIKIISEVSGLSESEILKLKEEMEA